MNSTLSDWNTKFSHNFDHLNPSIITSDSNSNIRDILIIIGLITICLLLFISIIQFFMKVRHIYQTSEPKERYQKSHQQQTRFPSYQQLLNIDDKQCKCFQTSCLPKFQCDKTIYQKLNQSSSYEQINERQINNSMCRVFTPNNTSCIRVHIIK